ncbi:MAG: hypothetical protein ACK41F_11360, partial [Fimbriimonadaceae bacterium]
MAASSRHRNRLEVCDRAWDLVRSDPLASLLIAGASAAPGEPSQVLGDAAVARAWTGVLGPRDRAGEFSMLCYLARPPKPPKLSTILLGTKPLLDA